MTVVDSHVHLLPGRIGEKVRAFFTAGESSGSFTLAYPADHTRVADQLLSEGVDEIWCLPYSHRAGIAEGLNEATAGVVASLAGHRISVVGGATVHPADDSPARTVTRAIDTHGLRVLKLHCSVGDFAVDDPGLSGAYRTAAERRVPVVIHLGHAVNGLTEAEEIASIGRVCAAHPDLRVVLAHYGHHSARVADTLFADNPNLHADLTPVVTSPPDVTAQMLEAHPDRVLFGTDAPNTAISAAVHMRWLRDLGLCDESLAMVLGGNARRLTDAVLVA